MSWRHKIQDRPFAKNLIWILQAVSRGIKMLNGKDRNDLECTVMFENFLFKESQGKEMKCV